MILNGMLWVITAIPVNIDMEIDDLKAGQMQNGKAIKAIVSLSSSSKTNFKAKSVHDMMHGRCCTVQGFA